MPHTPAPPAAPLKVSVTLFDDAVLVRARRVLTSQGGIILPGGSAVAEHQWIGVVLAKGPGRPATKDEIERYEDAGRELAGGAGDAGNMPQLRPWPQTPDGIVRYPMKRYEVGDTVAFWKKPLDFCPGGPGTPTQSIVYDSSILAKVEGLPAEPSEEEFARGKPATPGPRGSSGPSLAVANAAGDIVGIVGRA